MTGLLQEPRQPKAECFQRVVAPVPGAFDTRLGHGSPSVEAGPRGGSITRMAGADLLGWVAASLFPFSYLCKKPLHLVVVQMCAAAVWISYGIAISSKPVIAANVVVVGCAAFSAVRFARRAADPKAEAPGR